MHATLKNAPAVRYPVRRSVVLGCFMCTVLAGAAALLLAWSQFGAAGNRLRIGAAVSLWLFGAFAAWHFWSRQFVGVLAWNGSTWSMEPPGPSMPDAPRPLSAAEVVLDLQACLWVCVKGDQVPRSWLWLERRQQPHLWQDLRRALYSRATLRAESDATTSRASGHSG